MLRNVFNGITLVRSAHTKAYLIFTLANYARLGFLRYPAGRKRIQMFFNVSWLNVLINYLKCLISHDNRHRPPELAITLTHYKA